MLAGMNRRRLIIAALVGLVSEMMPIPGLIAAAVVFREGVHSDHAIAYLVLALVINLLFVAAVAYGVMAAVASWQVSRNR
jgi:hypothetical protein